MSSYNQMFVRVIKASRPTNGAASIITIHARYPRIFHSEIMTHRVFSRNARSSRAVPVMTMLKEIWNAPFVPWHWGKNKRGMQAGEPITGMSYHMLVMLWLLASKFACIIAYLMLKIGVHKQIPNRLLEPFSFIDTLITSTDWANFIHLRDHEDAEPHLQDLAKLIRTAIEDADYQILRPGEWHLPFIESSDYDTLIETVEELRGLSKQDHRVTGYLLKISVARCARISYKAFDGDGSVGRELERYELLVGSEPLHASPAEHQAKPMKRAVAGKYNGNLGKGWIQYRKQLPGEYIAIL